MEEQRIFFKKADRIESSTLDKKFESAQKYYTMKGKSPKYQEVINAIKNELDSNVGIILVGRSLSGKTRTAFEAMRRMADFWVLKLTQQKDYSMVKKAKRLFKGKRIILFLDDLHDFAKLDRNPEELLQALCTIREVAKETHIIATLRGEKKPDGEIGGEEIDYLKEKGDKLYREIFLKCQCIMLPNLSDEEGEKMAEDIGFKWDPENFDGTIGSVVEKIGDMKNKYDKLPKNARDILYSLRALNDAGVFFPENNWAKDVAENVYRCSYVSMSDSSFHKVMDLLCGDGFLFTSENIVFPRHSIYTSDKFLDEYSENINPKIFDQIEELAFTKWRSFDSLLGFGSMWEYYGDNDRMLMTAERLVELDDKSALAWYNKGVALGKLGKYQGAIECCDKALDIDPKYVDAWYNKGVILGELGDYQGAIECYDKALKIEPKDIDAWNNKGAALGELGDCQGEIECYDKALEIDPKFIKAWFNKGVTLVKLGEHQRAMECFDEALDLDPKYIDAWLSKGVALRELGEHQRAIECIDKALEIDPENRNAWPIKGVVLGELGEYKRAIECFDKALKIDPKYIYALTNKGVTLGKLGDYQKAIEYFDEALKIDPTYIDAWLNKGIALEKLGEHQRAIEYFGKALEIDPKYTDAWYNKGVALLSLGIFEDALLPFSKCIELREDLYGYIFSYLIQRNSNREFQELVNKGLKCKQSDWPYQVLEYFAGKITEQELILLAGSDPQKTCEVHCYVGYVYKFTGDTAQAMEHFQVSIETNQKELVVYTLSQIELDKLN